MVTELLNQILHKLLIIKHKTFYDNALAMICIICANAVQRITHLVFVPTWNKGL